jgi:hypothetical protein
MLPGPVTMLAGGQDSVPYANIATAVAPPAEQRAGREDRGVRESVELGLGRGGQGDRGDAGLLGRDHVHDHGGGVHRAAAGGVETDALDRYPLLGDRAAGDDLGGVRGAALLAVDDPGAADRLLQGRADGRGELLQGLGEGLRRDPHGGQAHSVELLGEVDQRRVAPMVHGLADRTHLLQGGRDVEVGSGQQVAQGGSLREGVAAQIDSGDHVPNSLRPASADIRAFHWLIQGGPGTRKITFTSCVQDVTQRASPA